MFSHSPLLPTGRRLKSICAEEGRRVITRTEGGRDIYYDVVGAGPDLMLVHGALSDADSFAGLIEILSDQFRCITLDRPGYNRSGRLDCATNIEEQAEAVEAVRRACGAAAPWIFGHSSGGNFALGHACLFPGSAKGLIMMEPALYAMYSAAPHPACKACFGLHPAGWRGRAAPVYNDPCQRRSRV
jgi:pimeloyl-ACP methyl ester carboxylesterase